MLYDCGLEKGNEVYIVRFADNQHSHALDVIERWAGDQSLSFDWLDCAKLRDQILESAFHANARVR